MIEGLSVLYASRDREEIEGGGPVRLARILYPDRIPGRVLHHEPVERPDWYDGRHPDLEWSEVIIEDRGPRTITRRTTP